MNAVTGPVMVCLKYIGLLDGAETAGDARFAGVSPADRAALELGLQIAERRGTTVTAVTVGERSADAILRDAMAAGAQRVVRIEPVGGGSLSVARALADLAAAIGAGLVVCGDYSLDNGTGSVPAYLAAILGLPQALGLVSAEQRSAEELHLTRRLDGGRREVLAIRESGVLSFEGSAATLRRAPLPRVLDSRTTTVEVVPSARSVDRGVTEPERTPYRPRARVLPPPSGASALDRLRQLTDAAAAPARADPVTLAPSDAARRILDALAEWGYLSR